MDKLEEAESLCRLALQAKETSLGAAHPDTLISLNNLAALLADREKYEEAEQICRRAFEATEAALGPTHPDTLAALSNLAAMLQMQGKLEEEALPLCQVALDAR